MPMTETPVDVQCTVSNHSRALWFTYEGDLRRVEIDGPNDALVEMRRFGRFVGLVLAEFVTPGTKVRLRLTFDGPGKVIKGQLGFIDPMIHQRQLPQPYAHEPPPTLVWRDRPPWELPRGPWEAVIEEVEPPPSAERLQHALEIDPLAEPVYQIGVYSIIHGAPDAQHHRAAAFVWDIDYRTHPALFRAHGHRFGPWDAARRAYRECLVGGGGVFADLTDLLTLRFGTPAHVEPLSSAAPDVAHISPLITEPMRLFFPTLLRDGAFHSGLALSLALFAAGSLSITIERGSVACSDGKPDSPFVLLFSELAIALANGHPGIDRRPWVAALPAFVAMQEAYLHAFGDPGEPLSWSELFRRTNASEFQPLSIRHLEDLLRGYQKLPNQRLPEEFGKLLGRLCSDGPPK